jgi:hypothetical protein
MCKYKYDVAISFAEKDRNAALAMALALELNGFENVYYYPDQLAETTGKGLLTALEKIYSNECKYIVLLLSDKYLKGKTSKEELRFIYERIKKNKYLVCAIPVKLHKELILSKFPLLKEITKIDWDYNPKRVAKILEKNFGAMQIANIGDILVKEEKKHYKIKQINTAYVVKTQINTTNI